MDPRGPRLRHLTKPLQVCPCDDGGAARSISPALAAENRDDWAGPRIPCPRCQPEAYSPSDVR